MSGSSSSSRSDEELVVEDARSDEESGVEDEQESAVEDEPKTEPKKEKNEQLQPIGKPKHKAIWKKVEVNNNFINVKGGFNAQYAPAPSISYQMGKEQHSFVQLSKNHSWFLKGVGGISAVKGELKAVKVLQEIRNRYNKVAEPESIAAVAEDAEAESDEDDPMKALDAVVVPSQVPKAKAKSKAKAKPKGAAKAKARPRLLTFKIPKHPPCSGWDQEEPTGLIDIHVYKKASSSNACSLYLRSDNISWLLQYAADELMFQGVVRHVATREDEDEDECNSEVSGLHLDWDFVTKAWTAKFVSGDHVGTTKRFVAEQLTKQRWKKMIQLSIVDRQLDDLKKVSERFITLWCQAVVDQKDDDFEKEWGLENHFETPTKKPRRRSNT